MIFGATQAAFLCRSANILYIHCNYIIFHLSLFFIKSFLNYFFIFLNHFLAAIIMARVCRSQSLHCPQPQGFIFLFLRAPYCPLI